MYTNIIPMQPSMYNMWSNYSRVKDKVKQYKYKFKKKNSIELMLELKKKHTHIHFLDNNVIETNSMDKN